MIIRIIIQKKNWNTDFRTDLSHASMTDRKVRDLKLTT